MQRTPLNSFEPTEAELDYFIRALGVEADIDLAQAIKRELGILPGMWTILTHAADGALLFMNIDTGQVTWEHPRITEISKLVRSAVQGKTSHKEANEARKMLKTETGLRSDIVGIRHEHKERLKSLQDEAETCKNTAYRRYLQDTRDAEVGIKAEVEAAHADTIRRLKAEAADYERTEEERLNSDAARERRQFHAELQMAQTSKHRVILDENGAKAFQLKKKEEVRFKNELKALHESLQKRKVDVTLVVADYEKYRAELEAKLQDERHKMNILYMERKEKKLKTLEENAKMYCESNIDKEIKPLREYVDSYDVRLESIKEGLRREFEQEIACEIDKLTKIYHAKIEQIRRRAERHLVKKLDGLGKSADASDLLKSQVVNLQEKFMDEVLRASVSLSSQNILNQLTQNIEATKKKLEDADLQLSERNKEISLANKDFFDVQENVAEPKTLLHTKRYKGSALSSPRLNIKSSFADLMSAPTSTKASTGRNGLFRSPINFEVEESSDEEDIQLALRKDMRRKLLSCDGGIAPSSSVPDIRQSLTFYSRLLSRQVQSRIDLKASLNKHSTWMNDIRNELSVALSGVRAKRRYVERRPFE
mmetsp:Transcript_15790/g.28865  ORF Transcript_15790/g.28865 Transcript_15790/m.28865 type:complete len:595 (-) Transcript_15790:652-2436(-)